MKTSEEIYREMLQCFTAQTGFEMEAEADLAVRLQAAAAQIESLYAYCDFSLRQSFPQSASGEMLDAHGQLRGISRKSGAAAQGVLRFSVGEVRSDAVCVPCGTVCTTAGLVRFVTTQEIEIPAGALYADAPAIAEECGTAGNAAAGTVTYLTQAPTGIVACRNPAAFTGGSGAEDDESLRARILASYARLPNGANRAFYETRARSHEGVGGVKVIPRVNGIGTVGVVIAGRAGAPEAALVQAVQADLDAVREIAVDVQVRAPELKKIAVSAALYPKEGVSFAEARAAVESALGAYFTGERLGETVYRAELGNLFYATGMLKNYILTAPAADVTVTAVQLPTCGAVTLTEGG